MQKAKRLLLLLLVLTVANILKGETFIIARDGQAKCSIVVNEASEIKRRDLAAKGKYNNHRLWMLTVPGSNNHRTPAEELQYWTGRMSGAKLKVVNSPAEGANILLGTKADFPELAEKYKLAELGVDGFVIASSPEQLLILGQNEISLQNAVFYLLNKLGCRWLIGHPDWIVVPEKKNLETALNVRKKPAFLFRRIWWGRRGGSLTPQVVQWARGNMLPSESQVYASHCWHRIFKQIEDHPEYFAKPGERKADHDFNRKLCVSNPEVRRIFAESVVKECGLYRDFPEVDMITVEPSDGASYCTCPECKKLGNITDQVVTMANAAAREVRKKYPRMKLGLLAYAGHTNAPLKTRLDPMIYIEFTTGYRHTSLSMEELIEAYKKMGMNDFGICDYTASQWAGFFMPGAGAIGRYYNYVYDFRLWRKLGVKSYYGESGLAWLVYGPGFWMTTKWLWDPELSPDELMNDFSTSAFGKAAVPMRRIYDRWALHQNPTRKAMANAKPWDPKDLHGMANRYGRPMYNQAELFSPRQLKLALLDIKEAYKCDVNLEQRRRIDEVAMLLHSLRLWLDFYRAGLAKENEEEVKQKGKAFYSYTALYQFKGLNGIPGMFVVRDYIGKNYKGFNIYTSKELNNIAGELRKKKLPGHEELLKSIEDDIAHYADVPVLERNGKTFGTKLVQAEKAVPEQVSAWGKTARDPMPLGDGELYFIAKRGEEVTFTYKRREVKCSWKLLKAGGGVISEGNLEGNGKNTHTVSVKIPADGIYVFQPGTKYPYNCVVETDRPYAWRDRSSYIGWNKPVYFYVPPGTISFIINSYGYGINSIELATPDGVVLKNGKLLARDEISVVVPEGQDGKIWSIKVSGARGCLRLLDVPPFLAASPGELMIPEECVK